MGENLPEYLTLKNHPDPFDLKNAGYDYLYVDLKYFTKYQDVIAQSCARLIDTVEDKNGAKLVDARYLFSVTDCVR